MKTYFLIATVTFLLLTTACVLFKESIYAIWFATLTILHLILRVATDIHDHLDEIIQSKK